MLGHTLAQVERAVFRVGAQNLRSRRAMEKIGGRLMPFTEYVAFAEGRTIEHVFYMIDRAGFAAGPLAP